MEEKKQEDFGEDGVDEFFGDDVDEEGQTPNTTMADRELAALQTRLSTLGYQDGVDDGVQEAVQGGFDQGYAAGAAAGWEAGSLYGGAAAIRAALTKANVGRSAPEGEGDSVLTPDAAAENASGLDDGDDGSTVIALPEATSSTRDGRLLESDQKSASVCGTVQDLHTLVDELRDSTLKGPDGPGLPNRRDVLRRLRLLGRTGAAVADGLEKEL